MYTEREQAAGDVVRDLGTLAQEIKEDTRFLGRKKMGGCPRLGGSLPCRNRVPLLLRQPCREGYTA